MQNHREDISNRLNEEFKETFRSWFLLAFGVGLGSYFRLEAPRWFQLFAFAYGLYFIHHLAARIVHKQRIHQIGNEVAIMAISKKMGLWDEGITEQVNEYLDCRSFDMSTQKVWRVVRARDW